MDGCERCVCDLTSNLGLSQSRLSFPLNVLKLSGLLMDRQSGRWFYYRLEPEAVRDLQAWLSELNMRQPENSNASANQN